MGLRERERERERERQRERDRDRERQVSLEDLSFHLFGVSDFDYRVCIGRDSCSFNESVMIGNTTSCMTALASAPGASPHQENQEIK